MARRAKHLQRRNRRPLGILLFVAVVGAFLQAQCGAEASTELGLTTFVLSGATGSLAMFALYRETGGHALQFYAAGRGSADQLREDVMAMLPTSLSCADDDVLCVAEKEKFGIQLKYARLKTADDYATLCHELSQEEESINDQLGSQRALRLFYLSVPPYAYSTMAGSINKHCRGPGKELRIAIEKPFGGDLASATQMVRELQAVVADEELYRVDHYLGKRGAQQILEFREANRATLESMLNAKHVTAVEIVMKETEDCRGRTAYYDAYGVVRDVMQNHLTELLALIAMDLPEVGASDADYVEAKKRFLNKVLVVQSSNMLFGQYSDYIAHVQEDMQDPTARSTTPTFSASVLKINTPRWTGVPFIITAGKLLDQRHAYVRVKFTEKDKALRFCLGNSSACQANELIFQLHGSGYKLPVTMVNLAEIAHYVMPHGWTALESKVWSPTTTPDAAYDVLVSKFFHGRRSFFVATKGLLASWAIWDAILTSTEPIANVLYTSGGAELNFAVEGQRPRLMVPHRLQTPSPPSISHQEL